MARQATDTLPAGDVRAFTSYAVNDGVARPYGQVPAGTPPRQSIEARAYVFVAD